MVKIIQNNLLITLFLIALFIGATFIRTINLSSYPVGFQIDEASLGYNAYSILHTGKSEAGAFLPLYIDTFGDNRPTGYNYADIPFIALFGLTVFATRIPGALFGAISVFPIFFLAHVLFKDKKIAIVSAILLAISPWSVVLSRASAETIIALFFILLGFALVFFSVGKKNIPALLLGTLSLALSFFFYHTPRIFVPMYFFASLLVLYFPYKNIWKNAEFLKLLGSFIFLCIVSFLLIFAVKGGTGRFSQVNIFGFPETKLIMAEEIREDGTVHAPLLETRMFHNKLVNYSLTFVSHYFVYFSGDFLFMHGGLPIWYQVDEIGLILLIECPFIIYGVYKLLRSRNRFSKLVLLWILIAPVTASLTVDDIPNLQRAIVLFPMLEIIAAVGVIKFLEQMSGVKACLFDVKTKHIVYTIFVLAFMFNFLYFLHQYFIHGATHRTWYRNNGFAQMMGIVNQNYNTYDKIITTKSGGGYPLFLFFSTYNAETYQQEGSPKDPDFKGFGKYIFVPNDCPSINASVKLSPFAKVLYVDRGTCNPPSKKSGKKYTDILREDGSLGFRVIY